MTVGFIALTICLAGCYQYRAQAPGYPGVTNGGEVIWSFLWGAVKEDPKIDNCNEQALAEVTVRDNFGFALLTVVSLGLVSPKKVEWKCARPQPTEGGLTPPDTAEVP